LQAVALDGTGVGVDDPDAGMRSQEGHQPRPERSRDVLDIVRRDGERGVELVVSVGPLV
jgi:hypothetical protein